jgi:hypothetical protein
MKQIKLHIIIPTQKIDGGNREIQNIIKSIDGKIDYMQVSIWKPKDIVNQDNHIILTNTIATKIKAILTLPLTIYLIRKYLKNQFNSGDLLLLTHYSTLIFLLKKNISKIYFVQDIEWNFVRNRFIRFFLKKTIISSYKKGKVIVANQYLEQELLKYKIKSDFNINIWASEYFLSKEILPTNKREVDFVMVLRNGYLKRIDLYEKFISIALQKKMIISFITQEFEIFEKYKDKAFKPLFKADILEMKNLYKNSKFFLHLSDHEGFGLPPLEAMGSGCIPLCRNSKGINAYMQSGLSENIFPLDTEIDYIFSHALQLQKNDLSNMQNKCLSTFEEGLSKKKNILDFFTA